MDNQQPSPQFDDLQFRVLIIGRANAGKTSILQRVCETTDSPTISRRIRRGNADGDEDEPEEVRGPTFVSENLIPLSNRLNLTRP